MGWPCLVLLLIAVVPQAEWRPPERPDPSKILQEAQVDAAAQRYALALEKHLWFHREALKYNRGLSAVRLSFALAYWSRLAEAYPPALAALQQARDEAWSAVEATADPRQAFPSFQEFAAINRVLTEESRTVTAFAQLDQDKPAVAARTSGLARPALVRAKEYALCAKYVGPEDVRRVFDLYRLDSRAGQAGERDAARLAFSERRFTNEIATVVALFVIAGRQAEAERVANDAKREKNDPEFVAVLDKALQGVVPEPWP